MAQQRVARRLGRRSGVDSEGGCRLLSRKSLTDKEPVEADKRPFRRQQLTQAVEAAGLDAKATGPGISAEASPVCRQPEIANSVSD